MHKLGFISANNYTDPYPVYPIGVSYLMTYLERRMPDCSMSLFDFNLDGSYAEMQKWCEEGKFDAVAISLRNIDDNNILSENCFVNHYISIVKALRAVTDAKIIAGGPGFSIFPALLYERLGIDFGIKGEGEESLYGILDALFNGKDWHDVDGLVYRDASGHIVVNPRSRFVQSPCLRMNPDSVEYYYEKSGMLNVQTKRGCPFNGIYCSYPIIDGKKVRNLDVDTVVDNIREMNARFGIDYLFFTDSVFNIDADYNEELCHSIIESGLKIRWGAYFSPRNLKRRDLELYQKAGLTHIEWGTDTLADATLESYRKNITWEQIRSTSKWASDLGIFYAHFMILGGYGETDASLAQTFERSRELGFTVFFPYIGMRIYPDTRLFDIALEEGLVQSASELVEPVYYVSKNVNLENVREQAKASGRKWIFPGDENAPLIEKFRAKHRRGPLWEYLRY
ncbi:MAG: lipid biosynthesis B12-binding/radical SAM protein [Candidatus Cryptobacteroides sp.]